MQSFCFDGRSELICQENLDFVERWLSDQSNAQSGHSAQPYNPLAAVLHQTPDLSLEATDVYLFANCLNGDQVETIRELLSVNCNHRQRVHIITLSQFNNSWLTLREHSFGGIARLFSHDAKNYPTYFESFTKQPKLKKLVLKTSNGEQIEIPI